MGVMKDTRKISVDHKCLEESLDLVEGTYSTCQAESIVCFATRKVMLLVFIGVYVDHEISHVRKQSMRYVVFVC